MTQQVPTVSLEEVKQLIETQDDYLLIDVREKDELEFGIIPTSHHLPLGELHWALETPPEVFKSKYKFPQPRKSKKLIFYCRTGSRSERATSLALGLGYTKARNFAGSILAWSQIDANVKMY